MILYANFTIETGQISKFYSVVIRSEMLLTVITKSF